MVKWAHPPLILLYVNNVNRCHFARGLISWEQIYRIFPNEAGHFFLFLLLSPTQNCGHIIFFFFIFWQQIVVIWDQWEVHILGKRLQFVYDYYTNVSAHLDAFSVSIVDQNSDIPSLSPMANNTII